jgi:hypothetical protein
MWLGERWGWWLATFYYLWAVFGVIFNWGHAFATGAMGGFEVYGEESLVIAVHAAILAYLLHRKIRVYSRLETMPLHWALAAPVCMAIAALVVTYLVEI